MSQEKILRSLGAFDSNIKEEGDGGGENSQREMENEDQKQLGLNSESMEN